jgi:16S rRNA (adenine1518-N6/adenine1519-N6)-dimethyltransferase
VWAERVVQAMAPAPDQTFIEIGPGRGALTRPLAARAGRVVAVEIDRDLAGALRVEEIPHVRVVEQDFLEVTGDQLRNALDLSATDTVRAAGNLPYNVASPIMFKLIDLYEGGLPIADAAVMLQREVADRLLAVPGTKDYGVLTILITLHARVERLLKLPAGAFRPPPKVQSTVVRLSFHEPSATVGDLKTFRALTQALFSRRRKTLSNALLAYPPVSGREGADELLGAAGIDGRRRPETLTVGEVAQLSRQISLVTTRRPGTAEGAVL